MSLLNIKIVNKFNDFFYLHKTLMQYSIQFILAFTLVVYSIISPDISLVNTSGDANSIWQTIISFNSEKIISSYVLYKGFLSVYPYLWLYDCAIFFGLNQFLFIKLYHAFLFSVGAGVAVPYCITKILNIKNNLPISLIFIILFFNMIEYTMIFSALMIDLPSFTFYSVSMALIIYWGNVIDVREKYFVTFFFGIMLGLVLSASGQYTLSGLILLIIFLYLIFIKNKKNIKRISYVLILITGILIPKFADYQFNEKVISPMRISGEWIPSGGQWFSSSMSRMMDTYKYGFPHINNRGKAIMYDYLGDSFDDRYAKIKAGGNSFNLREYLYLLVTHPVDFIVMWFTKLFLSISFDGGKMNLTHLFISYSSILIFLLASFKNKNSIQSFNNRNTYFCLSILGSISAPVFLHVEMRYGTSLLAFILCFSIYVLSINARLFLSNFIMHNLSSPINIFGKVFYIILIWLFFIILGLSFFGAISEVSSSDPNKILYTK